jgi:hypothetical protein
VLKPIASNRKSVKDRPRKMKKNRSLKNFKSLRKKPRKANPKLLRNPKRPFLLSLKQKQRSPNKLKNQRLSSLQKRILK